MQWSWVSLLIRSAVVLVAAEILGRFPRRWAPADDAWVLNLRMESLAPTIIYPILYR
jgi:hypothetical protein